MLKIRPVQPKDHAELLALANLAGVGMSSLPHDAEVLQTKIANSVASFGGKLEYPKEEKFLFVLEDTDKKKLVGTTGVVAHVGLRRPFYSYKLSTITQASTGVGIYSLQHVLHMVNDYTDASEIGSLFLHPDYRRDGIGKMLSRCRYLLLAEFPELFSDMVISEIRGVQDKTGNSPFYNNIAKHFFKMEFKQADYIYATQGAQFIADLMPRYPIYVNLLPNEAQEVIGVPLEASRPALELLKSEGFHYEGYIDLFDAGPTMQATRLNIRTVRKSHKAEIKAIGAVESEPHMICTTELENFTIAAGALQVKDGGVHIDTDTAGLLGVKVGDSVRYVA